MRKCYVCGEPIETGERFFYIGNSKSGDKMYRHDDDEHTQAVLDAFVLRRDKNKGEQIG